MKISKIEHLGIAVKSIEEALPYYEQVLGFECYNIETVEDQKVRTAFLKVGETKIELLEATSPESTIAKFIENRGEGIHHIAYAVEDGVQEALAECEAKEVRTIDKVPRNGAEGFHVPDVRGVLLHQFCARTGSDMVATVNYHSSGSLLYRRVLS